MVWSFLRRPFVAAMVLCGGFSAAFADEPMRLPVDADSLTIISADRKSIRARFSVEIADTLDARTMGLMHRVDLPRDRGMLFVWERPEPRFFWMENTPTPLDIIFAAADGRIVAIAKQTTPFSRQPIPSAAPSQFVLEIHAGLTNEKGIMPGDFLRHPKIGRSTKK